MSKIEASLSSDHRDFKRVREEREASEGATSELRKGVTCYATRD